MNVFLKTLLMLGLATLAGLAIARAPPIARVEAVTETLHGVTLADPYRYFENAKSPEVQKWLIDQGTYARETLDRIDIREKLDARITELTAATGDVLRDIVRLPGNRIYYLKRFKSERQFKLMMRVGFDGAETLLVDPEVDSQRTGIPHALNYFKPSWDGAYMAYGMSAGGSEDASLYILDIAKRTTIGAPIPRVHGTVVNWLPDSKSLSYNQLKPRTSGEPETEHYLDSSVKWLRVGATADEARVIFDRKSFPKLGLSRLDNGIVQFSPDSRWMIARTTDTTLPEGLLYVAKLSDLAGKRIHWTKISGYADKIVNVELAGDTLYLLTHKNSPRKHLLALDLKRPDLRRAREVVASPKDGVLEEFIVSKDGVVGAVRQGTNVVIRRYPPGNVHGDAVTMPFKGTAGLHDDPAHAYSDALYSLSGWSQMPRTFVLANGQSTDTQLRVTPPLPGLAEIEVLDVEVPSHDGARIPMTLLYKKGLVRDGTNPTLLNAYAAYGFSMSAGFSTARMAWIEQGGIVALANVRGSGVHGHEWYQAGFKATKANTWKDGIACAKYLIAEKYASPKTLAVMGTSAGGIFVGRSVTAAPKLFAAAIFDVGVMDAVRAEDSANGITNISEFGSYKNASEFPALLEMSTYHQIKDGTAYPAVMLVHGMNDPRVDVWHSAKAAARLQAASTSGKPVLLRLDLQAGHGMGSTINQRNSMSVDIYGFLLWQMGRAGLR